MKGILFIEADGEGLVTKCEMHCTGLERLIILDDVRKALGFSKDAFVKAANMLSLLDLNEFTETEKTEE